MSTRIDLDELLLHEAFVRRLARRLVRDEQRAEDLVQDTWVAALERAPNTHVRGWLGSVVRRIWSKELRGEERRHRRELEASRVEASDLLDEAMALEESRRLVVEALFGLTESLRTSLLLRYFEGLPPRRIARRLDIPVETVKTRLRRGLAQLREALDKRTGGDRATWMSAVTALVAPVDSGVVTGSLVIGGMAMGTMIKVSAAVLVAAACVYFVTRTPQAESPRMATVAPPATDVELEGAAVASLAEDPARSAVQRSPVVEESPGGVSLARGANVLRVVLEGITEEDARVTTVTLTGVDERAKWPAEIRDSWPCEGLTSDFDLDPFLGQVAERDGDLRVDELDVVVDHPLHFRQTTRIPLSGGAELISGQTVYEVRVQLVPPVYWPELTLAVRDATTRAHLVNVELYCVSPAYMGTPRMPGTAEFFTSLGGGLNSPLVLLGGHEADDPEHRVAGIAMRPAAGEAPELFELARARARPERGVIVYARAPGYAWASIALDVSTDTERELMLGPAAALNVRMTNVQLERYTALGKAAFIETWFKGNGGGSPLVRFQRLDETLETEELRLEGVDPGEYTVSVELRGAWKRTVLAREELSLAAGETRELVLALSDPPGPPERATLGGVLSFPAFGGEEDVRLQFYEAYFIPSRPLREADVELTLADMKRVGGVLPTWSFHLEDMPAGRYQVQLLPFLKNWMIELPAGGLEDVELVIPELAEVLVETVDARTGDRIPFDELKYGYEEELPGQINHESAKAYLEEPGRFRFWTAPGSAYVLANRIPSGLDYRQSRLDLELVPGLQSVRFELGPVCAIRFEFRDGEAALPHLDRMWREMRQGISAVDHEGRVHTIKKIPNGRLVDVSAPGVYEISFEGVGADRFLPIPPRRVDVREGETAEVIVELHRK